MMKRIYSLTLLFLFAIVVSCTDDSLDPLNMSSVKKGTILALRGVQLQNIYVRAVPGALFVPGLTTGTEAFTFDAEFLSSDPSSLASVDVFVVKNDGTRILLTNVPASEFKQTSDYLQPWATISIPLRDILPKLGYPATFPVAPEVAEDMFVEYENGIVIESDLNLTDGSKVTPELLVSNGLYLSNQFYPAQRLTYTVVKYCPEEMGGTVEYSTQVSSVGEGGDIDGCAGSITGEVTLTKLEGAYGTYSISDVSFGQYDCAWGDDPAAGATLRNVCGKLSFGGSDQYGLVYTISGVIVSPDQTELTFSWENDYGDKGKTTLTRTDGILWDTDLN